LGLALILDRGAVILWVSAPFQSLVRRLRASVQAGQGDRAAQQLARSRNPVARVAAAYLRHARSEPALREEVVTREASQLLANLEKRLSWLALIAQVTPLLGLLGTVLGLMNAFQQIEIKGSQIQSADLAVGIWQKLICTATGMVIAIPCLVAYYWFEARVSAIGQQMEWVTSYLNEWLKAPAVAAAAPAPHPGDNGHAARPPAPAPAAHRHDAAH
jgi:biopolymer transport protein ExbB